MSIEIPIWVNGKIRWLSGINKKTSCKEVVQVLLDEEGVNKAEAKDFAIIERWRKVERPLDEYSKILKIWHHWGNEKKEVRFCLRRIDNEVDSGRGSPIGNAHAVSLRRKRNRLRANGKPPWAYRETLHPRRLAELGNFTDGDYEYLTKKQNKIGENFEFLDDAFEFDNKVHYENIYESMQDSKNSNGRKNSGHKSYHCSGTGKLHSTPLSTSENHFKKTRCCSKREHRQKINSENIEKLMKLILAQGATIQSQLQKLKEREEQIESLEHEKHRERIEKNGRNYLLETYLGSLKDAIAPDELENKNTDTQVTSNEITHPKPNNSERANHNKTDTDVNKCNKIYETTIRRPGQRDEVWSQSQHKSRSKSESRLQENKSEGNLKRTLSDNALPEKSENASQEPQITKEELEDILELKKIQSQIEVWEKVFTLNKKLEKEEENLVRLHIKIKKIQTENYKYAKQSGNDFNENLKENSELKDANIDSEEIDRDRMETEKILETLRSDLEHNSKEIYQNFTKLIEEDEVVQQKRSCLSKLLMELERTDHEHNMLSKMILIREKQISDEQQQQQQGLRTDSSQNRNDSNVECSLQDASRRSPIENNAKLKLSNFSAPAASEVFENVNTSAFDSLHSMQHEVNQRPNLHASVQEKYNFMKPKIVKIAFEDKIENYENSESGDDKLAYKEPVPVPMGALKSILKNRQNAFNQPRNLNKGFQKSGEELPLNKETVKSCQKNLNFSSCNSQNDPTFVNYSYRIPYPLCDRSTHIYGPTYYDQLPLTKVSEELKATYSIKPFNPVGNGQTSANSFTHSTMVTTKALVHNDTDSSTSSDTSGLSSMYSSSPTVEEPYVEHSYILDTLV